MRILVRGGSIAAGAGVNRSYVDILRDHLAPRGIEVINRSRTGETSFDGVETFGEDIESFQPDILILHFGVDDAFSAVYRSEFKENLVRIVRLARDRFDPLIILLTSHGFDNPHDMEAVGIYYRAIREVGTDLYCDILPIHTYWAGYLLGRKRSGAEFLQKDARFPNEKGHEIYAEAIIQKLNRLLQG
ncbi:MAG TPA: SGNH/GDSL hydrolase family protein [Syntrophales bacterium]|jgi:lysophospholipase L1-like esterase|nr:SGNH/GDSL hydrolase family protein [Syntrophales bacterium]HRT60980.1 SGNH/GDSL hydrolase family protein [Syntrophales bacterium]